MRDLIKLLCSLGIDPYIIPTRLKQGAWIETKEIGINQALLLDPFKIKKITFFLSKVVQEVNSGGDSLAMQCEREI